jgi:hypothetical protein
MTQELLYKYKLSGGLDDTICEPRYLSLSHVPLIKIDDKLCVHWSV